jgi:hypothetical protein
MRVMQLKEAFSKHAVLELRVFDVFFYLRSWLISICGNIA